MTEVQVAILGVALVCAFFGVILGYLLSTLRSNARMEETKLAAAVPPPAREDLPGVRLWRDAGGAWLVAFDRHTYRNAHALDATQRAALEQALAAFGNWLGAPADVPPGMPAVTNAPSKAPEKVPAVINVPSRPIPPAATENLIPESLSMVAQIADVYDEMTAGTALAQRKVRLTEDLRGGVIVWIENKQYEGLDAIPDPEIKAALRAAGEEWVRRKDVRH